MSTKINKALFPIGGLGTRFLPLSKTLPKELLPVGRVPMIEHAMEEINATGMENAVMITSESKKGIERHFKESKYLESVLKDHPNREKLLETLKNKKEQFKNISFSSILQKEPKGDGDAILRAERKVKDEGFGVLFPDDIFSAKVPVISQLEKMFQTSQKPVVGLVKVSEDKIPSYGSVAVEKIANKLYKIKEIKEKVSSEESSSNLVVAGRFILTGEIFQYLKEVNSKEKSELKIVDGLNALIEDGKVVYGYELNGDWLECGNMLSWMKSNLYMSLKDPEFGDDLKEYLKQIK